MALHHSGADKALVNMIEMRKQNRKSGLMKAKQRELLIRTRAMDILEVVNDELTFLLIYPPNEKYKKISRSVLNIC
jgi:hypothetical protein